MKARQEASSVAVWRHGQPLPRLLLRPRRSPVARWPTPLVRPRCSMPIRICSPGCPHLQRRMRGRRSGAAGWRPWPHRSTTAHAVESRRPVRCAMAGNVGELGSGRRPPAGRHPHMPDPPCRPGPIQDGMHPLARIRSDSQCRFRKDGAAEQGAVLAPGLATTAVPRATSSPPSPAQLPASTPPPLCCSSAGRHVPHQFRAGSKVANRIAPPGRSRPVTPVPAPPTPPPAAARCAARPRRTVLPPPLPLAAPRRRSPR